MNVIELNVTCQPDRKNKWSGLYIKNKKKKKHEIWVREIGWPEFCGFF